MKKQLRKFFLMMVMCMGVLSISLFLGNTASAKKKTDTQPKVSVAPMPRPTPVPRPTNAPTPTPRPSINMNPFSYINNGGISGDATLQNLSASWYSLMYIVAVCGLMVAIFCFSVVWILSRKRETRQEAKQGLQIKILLFIGICAFAYFMTQLYTIVTSLL